MSYDNHGSLVRRPGEGNILASAGDNVRFLAYKEETRGNYGLVEYTAGPDFQGPASHIHAEMEEGFYVLEGEFTLQLGDEHVAAPAGTFVLIPRGLVHTFWNSGETAARFLLMASPGGFERYFEELVPNGGGTRVSARRIDGQVGEEVQLPVRRSRLMIKFGHLIRFRTDIKR